jgi:pimeloyl-ACP methyl ester carboxylesterase
MKAIVNGINMAWDDCGSGPVVCLIHGFPLNRRMWRTQINALAASGYRVITPDLRGFGESDVTDGPYSMDLFADDLAALLDHLGIKSALFGGMSMGGYVLLNILERYPETAAAACFIVTRSGADDEAGRERRRSLAADVMEFGPKVVADLFAKMLFAEGTAESKPELALEIMGWMEGNDPRGLAGALLAMAGRKDYTALLGGFHLPCLVIGAQQDKAVSGEQIQILAAALPDHKLCIIPEAGHLVNLEQPGAFSNCLLEFLGGLSLKSINRPAPA